MEVNGLVDFSLKEEIQARGEIDSHLVVVKVGILETLAVVVYLLVV